LGEDPTIRSSPPSGIGNSLRGVTFIDTLHGWIVDYNGRILYSSDGGDSWTIQYSHLGWRSYLSNIKAFKDQHKFDEAEGLYKKGYRITKIIIVSVLMIMVFFLWEQNRLIEAEANLRKASDMNPNWVTAQYNIALLLTVLTNFNESES
jgi:tetratricopeptide (TPR) repeat protein